MVGIYGIVGGLIAAAFIGWVLKRKADVPKRDPHTHDFILKYDSRFRAFLVLVGVVLLITWSIILARRQFETPLDGYLGTIVIAPAALWTLLEALRTQVRITPEGLVKTGAWGRTRTLAWSAIRQVKFSIFNQWFVLVGTDGTRLRVSLLMAGIGELERAVRAHLQPATYADAETGFSLNRDRSTVSNREHR